MNAKVIVTADCSLFVLNETFENQSLSDYDSYPMSHMPVSFILGKWLDTALKIRAKAILHHSQYMNEALESIQAVAMAVEGEEDE